jgi:DNA-3-methyladenine glycosylase
LKPLPRSFYLRPTLQVAQDLLGKQIVRIIDNNVLIGRIVEVEAYCKGDPASHAFRGRTKRNDVMFWEGGHLYVYFTYGMHFCANVVTGGKETGEAVLIRAVEPITGIEIITKKRFPNLKSHNLKSLFNLTNGPAKFCQAFGIARKENGADLLENEIFIINNKSAPISSIARSSRIGIRNGLDKKWRFYIKGNSWVSR